MYECMGDRIEIGLVKKYLTSMVVLCMIYVVVRVK